MNNSLRHRNSIVLAATLVLFVAQTAEAQKFKVLHTFHSGKGPQFPAGQLVRDAEGNLYGIAGGGTGTCFSNNHCGTAFKMTKTGKLVWVYSFKGPGSEGNDPTDGLLRDAKGNLFGVTAYGGVNTKACADNFSRICGVVFTLNPTGKKETVLYKFTGNPDGMLPRGPLIEDTGGNLYSATYGGGLGLGTVFKVSREGKETVLYRFPSFSNGAFPSSGVVRDPAGNLYGETGYGGDSGCGSAGCGVVYELDSTGTETVLHFFTGGTDGGIPTSGLTWDAAGNLYGTTHYGGNTQVYACGGLGCGVVFKLSFNSNGGWTNTTLYEFCSQSNCTDGDRPLGGLVLDAAGNLYGVTVFGGGSHSCNGGDCGVVFKLDTSGKETVLHAFTGGADGASPEGGLVMDTAGNLYGTALAGGDLNCQPSYGGCGVVFKITP